jgi:hypothetical protein
VSDAALYPVPDGAEPWAMRNPCKRGCDSTEGYIRWQVNGQDLVYCAWCGTYQYAAPKTETGRAVRSLTARGDCIKPKQRTRILTRDGGRCLICGNAPPEVIVTVGHILSHKDGEELGLAEEQIDSDVNLMAQCERCNSGLGRTSLTPWLYVALLTRQLPETG